MSIPVFYFVVIDEESDLKLKWYGHAAFRIMDSNGKTIITDPYTPEGVGYPPIEDTADIVIVSSDNDDAHCRYDLIPGTPTVVNALEVAKAEGVQQTNGVAVRAILAMETKD